MIFYKKMLQTIGKKHPPGSLEFYKAYMSLQDRDDSGARQDGMSDGAMNRALKHFGLDGSQPNDLQILLGVLCEINFGELPRGRKKGGKFWTPGAYLVLADLYYERASSGLSDTNIAQLISKLPEFSQYRNSPDEIRKRIPEARRQHEKWLDDAYAKVERFERDYPAEYERMCNEGAEYSKYLDDHPEELERMASEAEECALAWRPSPDRRR
jgi:hypothetical protein